MRLGYFHAKVVVIGANGQLGTDLCLALKDFNIIPLTRTSP
jgi:dTDP-4-dehydrorhamnose reductase